MSSVRSFRKPLEIVLGLHFPADYYLCYKVQDFPLIASLTGHEYVHATGRRQRGNLDGDEIRRQSQVPRKAKYIRLLIPTHLSCLPTPHIAVIELSTKSCDLGAFHLLPAD